MQRPESFSASRGAPGYETPSCDVEGDRHVFLEITGTTLLTRYTETRVRERF